MQLQPLPHGAMWSTGHGVQFAHLQAEAGRFQAATQLVCQGGAAGQAVLEAHHKLKMVPALQANIQRSALGKQQAGETRLSNSQPQDKH